MIYLVECEIQYLSFHHWKTILFSLHHKQDTKASKMKGVTKWKNIRNGKNLIKERGQ